MSTAARPDMYFAALRPNAQRAVLRQYLIRRIGGVEGVVGIYACEFSVRPSVTVVIGDYWSPARRAVHDVFYDLRLALQPDVDLSVVPAGTTEGLPDRCVVWLER